MKNNQKNIAAGTATQVQENTFNISSIEIINGFVKLKTSLLSRLEFKYF